MTEGVTRIEVGGPSPYPVLVGSNLLGELGPLLGGAARVAIIHPPTLRVTAEAVRDDLTAQGFEAHAVEVQGDAHRRAGQASERGGLVGVVDVEGVREACGAQPAEEARPGERARRQGKSGVDVGIEREQAGVGGLGEDGDACGRPVEPEIAQERAEQRDVAEVTSADHEEARAGVGHRVFDWRG